MPNPLDIDEAANIAVSRLLRKMYDAPTFRILALIDSGLTLEEAERIVCDENEHEPAAEMAP